MKEENKELRKQMLQVFLSRDLQADFKRFWG